jgi:hypothetical protein
LVNIRNDATALAHPKEEWESFFPLTGVHVQVLESVLVDVFSILRESTPLIMSLSNVRSQSRTINALVDYLRSGAYRAGSVGGPASGEVRRKNEALSNLIIDIVKEVEISLQILEAILSK